MSNREKIHLKIIVMLAFMIEAFYHIYLFFSDEEKMYITNIAHKSLSDFNVVGMLLILYNILILIIIFPIFINMFEKIKILKNKEKFHLNIIVLVTLFIEIFNYLYIFIDKNEYRNIMNEISKSLINFNILGIFIILYKILAITIIVPYFFNKIINIKILKREKNI